MIEFQWGIRETPLASDRERGSDTGKASRRRWNNTMSEPDEVMILAFVLNRGQPTAWDRKPAQHP